MLRTRSSRLSSAAARWARRRSTSAAAVEADLPPADCVRFEDVVRASHRIREGIVRTECSHSYWLSRETGCELYVKNEHTQFTGSFKERGARNSLASLDESERARGVIAASAGNHALALAWHGPQLGVPVTVVMPTVAPMAKVDKCRAFGAEVVIHGNHIGEAREFALSAPEHAGKRYINGYDDPEIIAGAGTLGIEMLEQLPDADAIVVPVGGAGLIAGISLAAKTLNPSVQVIGVEPAMCASYTAALEAGSPTQFAMDGSTLADGLAVPQARGRDIARSLRHHPCRQALTGASRLRLARTPSRLRASGSTARSK